MAACWERATSQPRTLHLTRPCCYGRVELTVAAGAPVATHARHCRPCGITWVIRVETIGTIPVDTVEWLDATSRAYIRRVEVAPWL
jgi:hypothetical protein